MAVFAQTFANSGFASAGFKDFVDENKKIKSANNQFSRANCCDGTDFHTKNISEQQSNIQVHNHYYSEMDTSDDFSAAELPLRYDALTGSYCIDTCLDHKNTSEKTQNCPQCCLAKYVLKIGNGKVELLEREEDDDADYSETSADEWKSTEKKKSKPLAEIYSPY